MSDPVRFLTAFTQALSTLGLYGEDHPATMRACDTAYRHLVDLQTDSARLEFTFLPGEVLFGRDLVPELEGWEWSTRFAQGALERLEVTGPVEPDHFGRFVGQAASAIGVCGDAPVGGWQSGAATIRFGRVRVGGANDAPATEPQAVATLAYSLREEQEAVAWLHRETATGSGLQIAEACAVVQSLSLAMSRGQAMVLPLLRLKEFDQYTTTHAINVSVLTMALAESVGLGDSAVRAIGLAGLLHDLGKIRIPEEILNKPGKLTSLERSIIEAHPVDGARLILEGDEPLDLAATVAYEHHLCIDGRGYPALHYPREAHHASRLVHVCDVYDALRTKRPYRDAWTSAEALEYIGKRAGSEFDPSVVSAFTEMMQRWDLQIVQENEVDGGTQA
ncbi:MAG TPA: HD domain-containing phosphohydrolase [Gemmatimonadales bacterium]|jgi:putative nucleotidyltransferase with HDIG domain